MVFSSYVFVAAFLPAVLIIYYLLSKLKSGVYQRLFLIAASMFFYGYFNPSYLPIIILSIAVNYCFAIGVQRGGRAKKPIFIIGVLFNVFLLGYFKYYDFFIENINAVFSSSFTLRHIVLPLGISFFTFQQLSFLISVYKGEEKVGQLLDYSLFISFFPQLVAGPIVLYSEMMPQFKDESRRYFSTENFSAGLYLFAIGLFKKAYIADTLAVFADNGFGLTGLGFIPAWATALSYTLQLYFDFSGYSDMAVGLGRMFNIDIPFNFDSPFKSQSITEFWRRWNITLGRALGTYIYKPLGGNRKGRGRTYLNLFATFFISGLWHGAAWTFVIWGCLHGLVTVIERTMKEHKLAQNVPSWLRVAVTFVIAVVLFVIFRADGMEQAGRMYSQMIDFAHPGFSQLASVVGVGVLNFPAAIDYVYILGMHAVLLFIVFRAENSKGMYQKFKRTPATAAYAAVAVAISLLTLSRQSVFIYFNF